MICRYAAVVHVLYALLAVGGGTFTYYMSPLVYGTQDPSALSTSVCESMGWAFIYDEAA